MSDAALATPAGESLQEYVDSRGTSMQVDHAASTIRGVKILGLRSRNGRSYLPSALAAAIPLYEGAKVNINHPKGLPDSPRDYQDRIGVLRQVAVQTGDGLFGELHLNPKHALAEQLLWDAEHAPQNVGLSHNVQAQTAVRDGQTIVESILKVHSVDLVADPATTRGLFEAARTAPPAATGAPAAPEFDWRGLTLERIREQRPDLLESAQAQQAQELARLRSQVDQLEAQAALAGRRALVDRLLREYGLPHPEEIGHASEAIVGRRFLESLLVADSEARARELVAERARLLEEAHTWTERRRPIAGRPRSRAQWDVTEASSGGGVNDFVRAIT